MSKSYIETPDEFLAHFGVKGMKWGVVKEEATGSGGPSKKEISAERKSVKREEKAKRIDAIADRYDARVKDIQSRPATNPAIQRMRNNELKDTTKARDAIRKDAQNVRDGKLTSNQKKLIVGASVAVGLMAAYGAYKFHDSGEMNQMMLKGKAFLNGTPHQWNTKESLTHAMDADGILKNVVKPVNPNYGSYGTKMNCRRCTFAYEMRRRGFDVKASLSNAATGQNSLGLENATNPNSALPTGKFGMFKSVITEAYAKEHGGGPSPVTDALTNAQWGKNVIEMPVRKTVSNASILGFQVEQISAADKAKTIFDALSTQPDRARGELGVGWQMGGGHSVAWEIIGGKPVVFDNQTGEKFDSIAAFEKFASTVTSAGFTRLDNVELNDNFLMRWLQNA